jgi:CubicO group peptidase (beta-lactamase class C family)
MQPTRRDLGRALSIAAPAIRRLAAAASGTAKIDDILRSGISERKIPAAVGMVADKSKTIYSGAFGLRDSSGPPVKPDSIFSIASMTKPVTTVAALQLVEEGKVRLEEPVSKYLSQFATAQVLDAFDDNGKPILRPPKIPVTLKHLLTHSSGLCYDMWFEKASRYSSQVKTPPPPSTLEPLMFDPGTGWQYGTGIDWAGRLVEAVSGISLEEYFQAKILRPLEMRDTSYILPESKFDRLVSMYQRKNGALEQNPRKPPAPPKSYNGGGGLYSTAPDYIRFMQMILGKGRGVNGAQILQAKTVDTMETNQIGQATAGKMKSFNANLSSDVDIQPGSIEKWGYGFLINTTAYSGGRSAGSLAWAGLFNTFFWIDPRRSLCAVLLMQFLPFVDKEAIGLLTDFERAVYSSV